MSNETVKTNIFQKKEEIKMGPKKKEKKGKEEVKPAQESGKH
jgi:hypothetical protein